MSDFSTVEYEALRATIRERGTARLVAVLAGLAAWGALAVVLLLADLSGGIVLVPFLVLVATFEINFFMHIGVERIGRYLQVFHEERAGSAGWETTAMSFGARFGPPRLDPLFSVIFFAAAAANFLSSFAVAELRPGWVAVSLAAHASFGYRIVRARKMAAEQRAVDLERFRGLAKDRLQ